jgi:Fe-S-cluster containining protein
MSTLEAFLDEIAERHAVFFLKNPRGEIGTACLAATGSGELVLIPCQWANPRERTAMIDWLRRFMAAEAVTAYAIWSEVWTKAASPDEIEAHEVGGKRRCLRSRSTPTASAARVCSGSFETSAARSSGSSSTTAIPASSAARLPTCYPKGSCTNGRRSRQDARQARRASEITASRSCDGCDLCCTAPGIAEMHKPPGVRCDHLAGDRLGLGGSTMTTVINRVLGRAPPPELGPEHATQLVAECATCAGLCCKGDAIILHPELGDDPRQYQTVAVPHPFTGKPVLMLEHAESGDCLYLVTENGVGRCGIYDRRPVICRKFDCARSYASMSRPERRRMVRSGMVAPEVLEQGRRVAAAREKARDGL